MELKKYSIIYADPPWRYNDTRQHNPAWGGITYPTMSLNEICSLAVSEIAKADSALFLWATAPMLEDAFTVIQTWGFRYITIAFTWVKLNPSGVGFYSGLGNWTNSNAEFCLFAKRGRPKRIARNVKQLLVTPRGTHSAKPPEIRDRIVKLLGDLPRIELFAREHANGWDRWGNEVICSIVLGTKAPCSV